MAFRSTYARRLWAALRHPALGLAALVLCLGLLDMPAAQAQYFNPFGWFQQVFRPQRNYDEHRASRPHPRYTYHPHPTAKVQPAPAVPPSFFVAVLGDSLGQMLGQALSTSLSNRPEVEVLREAKEDSGLVRDDYYDWPKTAHDLATGSQKINVAVIMIGSNDHQTLHDATGSYDPGSDQYEQVYAARIEAIAKAFHDAKIPLIWVGLPVMKSDRYAKAMAALNDMYRQYAGRNGATYVDIWQDFVDDNGQFSPYGPDVDGQVVRLRALDGVHFTKAGALKLASFVEPQIRQILDSEAPPDDAALAKIETTAPAGTNLPAANGVAPVKPPIGPVLPLTGPVLSAGGRLATLTPAQTRVNTASLVEQGVVDARLPLPKPGRADDFAWPRQELTAAAPLPKPAPSPTRLRPTETAAPAAPAKSKAAAPTSAPR
jgi:uncharacterized protein